MHHERGGHAPSCRSSCTTGAASMHHPVRRIQVTRINQDNRRAGVLKQRLQSIATIIAYTPRSLHTTDEEVVFTDSVVAKAKNEAEHITMQYPPHRII